MSNPILNPKDSKKGLYQIVHDFEFVALNLGAGYTEIRNMSREEKYNYMCERLKKLKSRGYGGVVINTDFKDYLKSDDALSLCAEVARFAKSIGLGVWIYDEQYYPSGVAGGIVLEEHPELESLGIAAVTKQRMTDGRTPIRIASPRGHSELKFAVAVPINDGKCDFDKTLDLSDKKDLSGGLSAYLPSGEWRVYAFFYRALFEHSPYSRAIRTSHRFVNIFDKRVAPRFFDVTYKEGYLKHFGESISNTVDAIFTDEPHFPQAIVRSEAHWQGTKHPSYSIVEEEEPNVELLPYIPWSLDMANRYLSKYGENLIPLLPHLFEETEKSRAVRYKFYSLTSEIARCDFLSAYKESLSGIGIPLSGHYLLEESFDCHPTYFGDIIDHLASLSIPGCDTLRQSPDFLRYSVACKLASSASHLASKERTMIEASDMAEGKKQNSLNAVKGAVNIIFAHGVDLITSYWGEDILSAEEMTAFAGYVEAISSLISGGKYKVDTLLYYPYEELCARTIPAGYVTEQQNGCDALAISQTAKLLMENQACFDFINKTYLLSAKISGATLITENGETISRILLPAISFIDGEVGKLLNKAHSAGVEILSLTGERVEGLDFIPQAAEKADLSSKEIKIDGYQPYISVMHKSQESYDLFMIVNTDEKAASIRASILDSDNEFFLVDLDSYEARKIEKHTLNGYADFDIELSALEAKIILRKNS